MRLGSWCLSWLIVLCACGGRSTLDSYWTTDDETPSRGGAAGLTVAPMAVGGVTNQVSAGMTSSGAQPSSAGTRGEGMAGGNSGPKVATMISAGADMSCAVVSDGSVWCWGSNDRGQLGNGTKTRSLVPARVKAISSAVAVSAGGTWNSDGRGAALSAFACAVLENGSVVCWGDTSGDTALEHSTPHTILGVNGAIAIACGNWHACALISNGSVSCWGDTSRGQLGVGSSADCVGSSCPPTPVVGIAGVTAIAGQGSDFSCAVLADGAVWCWGGRNGSTSMNAFSPVRVPGIFATRSGIGVGRSNMCALSRADAELWCWGLDYANGEPALVRGLRAPSIAVSVGSTTTCALLGDATVQCWGGNGRGQLGNDTRVASKMPVDVLDLTDVAAISVGYLHSCALTKSGRIRCWGANSGGLGDGSTNTVDALRPVTVTSF